MEMEKSILLVDDDADLREAVAELFVCEGFLVRIAADGDEALAEIRRQRPAAVLLDLRMPRKSGWDVLRELRAEPGLIDLPVIVLSADLAVPLTGASRWLHKPVEPDELLQAVNEMVAPPSQAKLVV